MYAILYVHASESLLNVLIITSTEEYAPAVGIKGGNWDVQFYRKYTNLRKHTSAVFDANRVIARHVANYNNDTGLGVTLSELEVFGTGMHNPESLFCMHLSLSYYLEVKHFSE